MNPHHLILTFANQLGSPELALLRLDPAGRGAQWVDLAAVRAAAGPHFNGLCGAAASNGRLAVCTQSIPAYLAIFDISTWLPLVIHPLEGIADPHGLVWDGDRVLVASTGTNEIFELRLDGDRIAAQSVLWRYPDTVPDSDMVHLNGLTLAEGELIGTAFGPRIEAGTWRGAQGRLFKVDSGDVIDGSLVHPHTPIYYQGKLYVCESSAGRVVAYDRGPDGRWVRDQTFETGGYPRGLWPSEDALLVGISSQRRVSRSQGVRVQGGNTEASGILRLDLASGAVERSLDLSPYGREIYEIVVLPGETGAKGIEDAVVTRAHALQGSIEALTDHVTRVNRELARLNAGGDQPLVTIVTPSYNRADFLVETIESVLSQDYPFIEFIVLDDGSRDATPEILQAYKDRLILACHANVGENLTVNRGLEMARGDVLCIVNSDDPLLPGAVRAAVEYLGEHPDVLAAYPDWVEIDAEGSVLQTFALPDYDIHSMLLGFNVAMGPGVFIRRRALELIGMRDETLRYTGDLDYWFRLSLRGQLGHIPQSLATHRTHEDAASSSAKGRIMAREIIRLVDTVYASAYLPGDLRARRHRIYAIAHAESLAYAGASWPTAWRHRLAGLHHALRSGDHDAWRAWTPGPVKRAQALGTAAWARGCCAAAALRQRVLGAHGSLRESAQNLWAQASGRLLPNLLAQASGWLARALWRARHAWSKRVAPAAGLRFALVSHVLPPMWSGQAMVIGRLLEHISPDAYRLISQRNAHGAGAEDTQPPRTLLPAESGDQLWLRGDALGALSVLQRIILRGWRIADQIRANGCNLAVASTGDLIDLPATAMACALTKVPLAVYLFDDYLNQWGFAPKVQRWARVMEKVFIAKASAVIVPNEALQEEISRRHGVEAVVVRNPAVSFSEPGCAALAPSTPNSPLIVYTGAVYHVNYAAFRTLIAAMGRLTGDRPRLDVYSAQDPAQLEREGLSGPGVRLQPHVAPDQAARIQREADVLFMGFSFDSEVPVVVRTSAPGKLGDYLASGRPILALVPPDSFLAHYLTDHRCGLVVDQDEPALLAVALERLLHEPGLAASLVENALTQARAEFAPEVAASRFLSVLEDAR